MAEGRGARSVADALSDVAQWRADEESRHSTELAEVDQEVATLERGIENLKQQLEALGQFRTELLGKVEMLDVDVSRRNYEAVFDALQGQSEQLVSRSADLLQVEQARDADLLQTLEDPEVRNLLAEYKQFRDTIAPTLSSMPATYRQAMEELGRKQREELTDRLGDLGSEPVEASGDPIEVDIIVAVDAPEGQAEVLMLVFPVEEAVHSQWASRSEDLQTRLAARVMQAVFATARALGIEGNQGVFGGHRGLLAVELELAGGGKAEIAEQFRARIQAMMVEAPELLAAKIAPTARVIEVDHLLPPEEPAMPEASA